MASNNLLTLPSFNQFLFLILTLLLIQLPSQIQSKPIEGAHMCSYELYNRLEKLCEVFSPTCLQSTQSRDLMATSIHCCQQKCTHSFLLSSCCSPIDLEPSELYFIPQ